MFGSLRPYISLFVVLGACLPQAFAASQRFSQLVMPFETERPFVYGYNQEENAIILELGKTSANELKTLNFYDDRVFRRVLVKDLGEAGVEVRLILRDRDLRSSVASFSEPFRIVVDVFDHDFREARDPATGLPRVAVDMEGSANQALGVNTAQPRATAMQGFPDRSSSYQSTSNESKAAHQLLRPGASQMHSPDELVTALENAPSGPGKYWKDFPFYIYRIQTAVFENERGRSEWIRKNAGKALSSAEAMADYAGRLSDFGHEYRAVMAYQQVLYKDPGVFDRDALHMWKLADGHLGQGNFTLADGYYETLMQKHPESQLARFAQLRRLDIKAIRALEAGRWDVLASLEPQLRTFPVGDNKELTAQVAIRHAFWRPMAGEELAKVKSQEAYIPPLGKLLVERLNGARGSLESSKTAFLVDTFLLNEQLTQDPSWSNGQGQFAANYFDKYKGPATEPFRDQLKSTLKLKLDNEIQNRVKTKDYLGAINVFQQLPKSLQSVRKTPQTSWALAEAYRSLGQAAAAAPFYRTATGALPKKREQFVAQFRMATNSAALAKDFKGQAKEKAMSQSARAADKSMAALWEEFDANERKSLINELKSELEQTAVGPGRLVTPARIMLEAWDEALTQRTIDQADTGSVSESQFKPSSQTIDFLNKLSVRFGELGDSKRRIEVKKLLRRIKPAELDDQESKQIWARELVTLADEMRQGNEFLEAGRLYAYAGSESENWAGRAEALYKGGLLLYRAGHRDEALEAFRKASEDGNNQFYANLAKERIARLEQ